MKSDAGRVLPRRGGIHDLPIPEDAVVDETWCETMRTMAEYIGAYDTLRLVDALGGLNVRFALNPRPNSRVVQAVGMDLARRIGQFYNDNKMNLPVGHKALKRARLRPILTKVRTGEMSTQEAAILTRLTRNCISNYVRKGYDRLPGELPKRKDDRQFDMFRPPEKIAASG